MPLQNRVTPFGDLIAVPERGLMLGNRGLLHNRERQIVRHSQVRRWIVCVLEFRGRRREIMYPGYYTELFFLDEATALSAGHRPCAECRRADYQRYRRAWATAHSGSADNLPSADTMDEQLQQDRLEGRSGKKTYQADIATLPDGVFTARDGEAWLLWQSALHHWTPGGYDQRIPRPAHGEVIVLTPRATAGVIAAGYTPTVHSSAQ
jgi:hypothetical protein